MLNLNESIKILLIVLIFLTYIFISVINEFFPGKTVSEVGSVELQGSCSGCPSSAITLKQSVQNLLCYCIPEITKIEAI